VCDERDTRNVACANDTALAGSYARGMTDRTGRDHTVKRIVIVLGVVAAFGALPSVAAGANGTQVVRAQVVESQVARSLVVESQVARSLVVAQRVTSQQARAQRAKAQRASSYRLALLGIVR
jgi:hypothetical protein